MVFSKVVMDRETQRSRGFGFVAFQQEASIERAIHGLDNKDFGGRTITVNRAKERDELQRCVASLWVFCFYCSFCQKRSRALTHPRISSSFTRKRIRSR